MEIRIDLKTNREVFYKNKIIGKTFENKATVLIFELDDEMIDKDFYIEFEKIDGTKFSTPRIDVLEKEVKYQVPNSLLDLKGDLKTEVVLRKEGLVFKTYTMKFHVLESINASEEIPNQYPDFVSEAQKVIDLIEFEGVGNKYLTDDGTYKSMQEIAGGVSDYEQLNNKPKINNIELLNNKTLEELGIQPKGDYLTNENDPTVPTHVKSISEDDISNWNSKSDFDGSYNSLNDKPTIPTKTSELTNDSSYASESFVTNAIANAQLGGDSEEIDLSGYATKEDLKNKVDKVTGKSLISDTEITRLASVTNYDDTEIKNTLKSKANTTDIPTKVSELTNDSGFITSIPSEYITETELNAKRYLTSVPSEYITETELNNKGYLTEVPSDYVKKNELVEITNDEIEAIWNS